MLPCQLHRDCVNCDEQVCVKGDVVREANIRRHRNETRILLEAAIAAQTDGDTGANRWVSHQQTTLSRLDKLCEILDDPHVPAGAVIQLSGIVPASRLQQAEEQRTLAAALPSFTQSVAFASSEAAPPIARKPLLRLPASKPAPGGGERPEGPMAPAKFSTSRKAKRMGDDSEGAGNRH